VFVENYAWVYGGAATLTGASVLTNCVFRENQAQVDGGAIRLNGPSSNVHKLVKCIFRRNSAILGSGGAIVCDQDADMDGCLFTANRATRGGGACHNQSSHVRIANSVIVGNRADQLGGGAWAVRENGLLDMVCTTVSENSSPVASFLLIDLNSRPASSHVSISSCVLSNDEREIWSNDSPLEIAYTCLGQGVVALDEEEDWLVLGPGNIDAAPCFVDPGYWDASGTPDDPNDDDVFVEGDYHLKSQAGRWDPNSASWVVDDVTSPCIDAGDPDSPVGDEPAPNGGIINMGAYGGTAEASMSPTGGPTEGQWAEAGMLATQGPTEGQWTEPMRLDGISSDLAEEWSPTLSADGLTLYFVRVHSPISEYGRIFQARRRNTSEAFASIRVLPSLLNTSPGHVLCQWVSPDQLRMYYTFQDGATFSLKVSERSSPWALWPMGADLWELNRLGDRLTAPCVTADEQSIFFSASDLGGTLADYDIWMAMRPDKNARFGDPVNVEPINTTFNEMNSFITPDSLTMYFASDRNGRYQLFRSARRDLDSPFESPVHMTLFDTPDGDSRFPFLAADGSEFYFQRETNQDRSTRDIWVSYRID
jgi:hypothetical protein